MKQSAFMPLIEELIPPPEPEDVFIRLSAQPHCLFLDSALRHPELGRYSFVAADPFDYLQFPADGCDALAAFAEQIRPLTAATVSGLPPFQGGAAGLLGYELGRSLESIPPPRCDDFAVPALAMGFYDVVIAFDHLTDRAWIISQGLPETDPQRRRRCAADRLAEVKRWLTEEYRVSNLRLDKPRVSSNFSEQEYLAAVRRVIDYIHAGDVFQVNLAQRLITPAQDSSISLYRRLRRCNPAPMAGYFDLGDLQIISASPERFLCVRDREVESRPIKGTRPRSGTPALDEATAAELLRSEKDRAENVMIVDLLRNDLSRVCEAESVRVSQLCAVETYQCVLHLVSAIRGRLRPECSPIDLLRASFPGGSITGAPKPRAMEIIAELEPHARGAYCGALGYLGFDGSMDLSILIRTITAGRGWCQFPVGGGIVAQSDPQQEYQETWHKAEGILRALYPT